jgi:hypothetical protein
MDVALADITLMAYKENYDRFRTLLEVQGKMDHPMIKEFKDNIVNVSDGKPRAFNSEQLSAIGSCKEHKNVIFDGGGGVGKTYTSIGIMNSAATVVVLAPTHTALAVIVKEIKEIHGRKKKLPEALRTADRSRYIKEDTAWGVYVDKLTKEWDKDTPASITDCFQVLGNDLGTQIICMTAQKFMYMKRENRPVADVYALDELSMWSIQMLLPPLGMKKPCLFMGDIHQLPPVCSNSFPYYDMVTYKLLHCASLTIQNRSNGEHLQELIGSCRERRSDVLEQYDNGTKSSGSIHFDRNASNDNVLKHLKKLGCEVNPFGEKWVQLVTLKNADCARFNELMQGYFETDKQRDKIDGNGGVGKDKKCACYKGDAVKFCENDDKKRYVNGTPGILKSVKRVKYLYNIKVELSDKSVIYIKGFNRYNNPIQPAYCGTIHKAQGSGYNTVLYYHPSPYKSESSHELVYTAVSRAKYKLLIFYNQVEHLSKSVKTNWERLTLTQYSHKEKAI